MTKYWLGKHRSKETKLKISKANKGRKHSEISKKSMSASHIGKKRFPFSEEHKKNISKSHKGKHHRDWKGNISKLELLERKAGSKKPNQCEICGAMGRICFDHNHMTGKFRGWICLRCNFILGYSKDNIELLNSIIEYLKKDK